MKKLDTFPYYNEKTGACSLQVDAPREMESKKEYFQQRKELLKDLDENNMEYRIHHNHSKGMKLIFTSKETLITFKMMFL